VEYGKVILSVLAGSRLYGYATENSDNDLRGICIPPIDYLLGLKRFDQLEDKETDTLIFSIQKAFTLLQKGHTQLLEILFAPPENIKEITDQGQLLIDSRNLFITKNSIKSILGFANAEVRKARSLSLAIKMEKVKTPLREIVTELIKTANLHNYQRDQIFDIVFADRDDDPREYVYSTRHLGERRKESVFQHGYSVKNACNALRLLHEAESLISERSITFPLPHCDLYRKIRNGRVNLDEFNNLFDSVNDRVMLAYTNCDLPKSPDQDGIRNLYKELIKGVLNDQDCAV
jgi:predicted nucleotidyltransferase